ncbi:MAG: redoxin domain-containing protein [Aeromicrobium sp.]
MRRLRTITVIVAAMLAMSACGSGAQTAADPRTDAPTSEVPTPAVDDSAVADAVAVPSALQFTSTTTAGKSFEGASLAGQAAVVWFWAPWCHVCQNEAPGVAKAAAATDVEFLGVGALDSADSMKGFVKKYEFGFTNLADTDAAVWAKFGVTAQPAFAFISAAGDIEVVPGSLSTSVLTSKIAELEKS